MAGRVQKVVDWQAVAKDQSEGMTYAEILKKYKIASNTLARAKKSGKIPIVSSSDGTKRSYERGNRKKYIMPEKQRKAHSMRMSLKNPGGKSKWYKVNGISVQGTWERDFALLLNENNVMWSRPHRPFSYITEDKTKHYTPDFYLDDFKLYIEIKGYWWGKDKLKMKQVIQQNDINVKILRKYEKFENFINALVAQSGRALG